MPVIDSINVVTQPDSTLATIPTVYPFREADELRCMEQDRPVVYATSGRPSYVDGIEGIPRSTQTYTDSGVVSLLLGALILVALSYNNYGTYFHNALKNLLGYRSHNREFSERTLGEVRLWTTLWIVLSLEEALVCYTLMEHYAPDVSSTPWLMILMLCGCTIGYNVFYLCVCRFVGSVFATGGESTQWLRGCNAAHTLLAIPMAVPALVGLFDPAACVAMGWTAAGLFVCARLVFISKGFIIFYEGIGSLMYFVLYLCSLEIIPLLWVLRLLTNFPV